MKTSICLVTLAVVLGGCGWKPPPPTLPLRLETQKFEKVEPGFEFRVEWPAVVNGGELLRKSLNSRIKEKLQPEDAPRGFAAEGEALFTDYQRLKKSLPHERMPVQSGSQRDDLAPGRPRAEHRV